MAVATEFGVEYTQLYITVPSVMLETSQNHGRMRVAQFSHTHIVGDATSDVTVVKLPPGNVRLYMSLSWAYFNWTTASATCDIGWGAYTNGAGVAVVADPNGLADGIDVDAVGIRNLADDDAGGILATTCGVKEFDSLSGVNIVFTSQDVAIVAADDLYGMLVYVVD